ncbi:MAG: hypothetical protein J5I94_05040 [Phaeodactylibacter sp.]|nr:hypothetical protein [Phaeodactylibacter sp.]
MNPDIFNNSTISSSLRLLHRVGALHLLLLAALSMPSCLKEKGPLEDEFPIFVDILSPGFDIGVTSSEKQYDWLEVKNGYLKMAYPAGQEFGSVFIVAGAVALERVTEDFSGYKGMALELKAEKAGSHIALEIEDLNQNYVYPQFAMEIPEEWASYSFPVYTFGEVVDLRRIRAPVKFVFRGEEPSTIYARNIRYLKSIDAPPPCYFPFFVNGRILFNYDIGVASADSADPDSVFLKAEGDILEIHFPSGRAWCSAFLHHNKEELLDLSSCDTLALAIRGQMGGEVINIGIRDTSNIRYDKKFTLPDTLWRDIDISPGAWANADLMNIRNPIVFTSYELVAQNILVRNIHCKKCN